MRICPICGKKYSEYPALSRKDDKTEICPQCGMLEALTAFGITDEKAHEALDEIREATEPKVKIYTAYAAETDITFIMEDKGNTTRVAGFYYGIPDNEATKQFYGKLMAEFS